MGTTKPIQKTKETERTVPAEIYVSCFRIRTSLNYLEEQLASNFPVINEKMAIPHHSFQEAWYNYCIRLSESISREKIEKSGIVPVFPVSENTYAKLIPNFIKYLRRFGEVGISSFTDSESDFERIGIFLSVNAGEPKLLGLLEMQQNPKQVEYSGYVPTNLSESEFFKHTFNRNIWHLSDPPKIEGINFAFVRLFAERNGDKFERYDAYGDEDRGIGFP